MAPTFEKLAAIDSGYTVAKLDATENGDSAEKYAIDSFPTLLMLLDGGIRVEYSGERSLEGMLEWLKKQENPFNRVNTVEELNGVR